jgi:HSP20 family protein
MPMDAYRVGDKFVAHFDLPGVDPGSIDLSVEGTTLTVTAERSVPQLDGAEWAVSERPFGQYTRQLVLGRSLDTDGLEASYHDGVLTLSIPVAEKARARKITVTRADTPAAVEHRTIEGEQSEQRAVAG